MDKRKLIIRIGKNTLSFTMPNATDTEQPVIFEPFVVKGGISMTANLREAFKTVNLMATDTRRVQVLVDTPSMLVPIEQFEEEDIEPLFDHTFPNKSSRRIVHYNVLPKEENFPRAFCLLAASSLQTDENTVVTNSPKGKSPPSHCTSNVGWHGKLALAGKMS